MDNDAPHLEISVDEKPNELINLLLNILDNNNIYF